MGAGGVECPARDPAGGHRRELCTHSVQVARIDGAISGTPFFIALVPGYLTYLLQETRMTLRTAALYGRDPGELQTAAEGLALWGVHGSVGSAEAALSTIRNQKTPDCAAAIAADLGAQRLPVARVRRVHGAIVSQARRRRAGSDPGGVQVLLGSGSG